MKSIKCGAQQYAWGKFAGDSKVAKLIGESDKPENKEKRFAELWIGVHDSKPSFIAESDEKLKDFLVAHQATYFGQKHVEFYKGAVLPFLLKVLSIDKALSIQAHPTRQLAEVLHARDKKNYPDPNHKPEIIVALTRFEALCCFRKISEIVYFLKQSPAFVKMIGGPEVLKQLEAEAAHDGSAKTVDTTKQALRTALTNLYATPADACAAAVDEQLTFIKGHAAKDGLDVAHEVFARTHTQFPHDVGLWMIYFLNYIVMGPGDGLFLAANEPHAYISGDGVEIMANSDNVVRAGLTPKYKDVETLLNMLTYDTNALAASRFTASRDGATVQQYQPPAWCDDFSLYSVKLSRSGQIKETLRLPSVALAICIEGSGIINGEPAGRIQFGSTFVVPIGDVTVELADGADSCTVFFGTTNMHGATASKI